MPASSAPCGRAVPRNTKPRSIPATSSPSPRSCATCIRSESQPEQSYSERQLYEAALDRLSREIAAVQHVTETEAVKEIEAALAKGPRRGPRPRPSRRSEAEARMTSRMATTGLEDEAATAAHVDQSKPGSSAGLFFVLRWPRSTPRTTWLCRPKADVISRLSPQLGERRWAPMSACSVRTEPETPRGAAEPHRRTGALPRAGQRRSEGAASVCVDDAKLRRRLRAACGVCQLRKLLLHHDLHLVAGLNRVAGVRPLSTRKRSSGRSTPAMRRPANRQCRPAAP